MIKTHLENRLAGRPSDSDPQRQEEDAEESRMNIHVILLEDACRRGGTGDGTQGLSARGKPPPLPPSQPEGAAGLRESIPRSLSGRGLPESASF